MTDRSLLQLVAGKSPAALDGALKAMRAIEAGSPIVAQRVARVAAQALRDSQAEWSDGERELLAEAAAGGPRPAVWSETHQRLTELLAAAGIGKNALADYLGIGQRSLRDWLPGPEGVPAEIPASRVEQVARVVRLDVAEGGRALALASDEVAVVMRRRVDGRERVE